MFNIKKIIISCLTLLLLLYFGGCANKSNIELSLYEYEVVDNAVRLTGCLDYESKTITLPDKIEGKPVEIIGKDLFYQHKDVHFIVLPETVTTIEGCPFYRCYSLEKILIPKNVTSIECNPFFRCSALTKIEVAAENQVFSSFDGILYDKDMTTLISYPEGKIDETYQVPDTVIKLNSECFGYFPRKLNTVIIPETVTEFPDEDMFIYPAMIKLVVQKNSVAEVYAKEHDMSYETSIS